MVSSLTVYKNSTFNFGTLQVYSFTTNTRTHKTRNNLNKLTYVYWIVYIVLLKNRLDRTPLGLAFISYVYIIVDIDPNY